MTVTYSSGNVIFNPGAETGPAAGDFVTIVPPSGWTTTGSFTAVTYAAGSSGDLNAAAGRKLQGGSAYFAGGIGSASAQATQTIDVSAFAAQIDAGGIMARLSGQIGGYLNQNDNMTFTARFLDSEGAELGQLVLGPVFAADRSSVSNLLARLDDVEIMAGTRSVEVILDAARLAGSYNDGYADNLGLHLTGLAGGFVHVAGTQNFRNESIGPSDGIAFDPVSNATATFRSTQFGASGIALDGTIQGSFRNDRVVIDVSNDDSFSAASFTFENWTIGKDRIVIQGAAGNEFITGSRMDDTLNGLGGADTLRGGAGRDTLDGGKGIDQLTGGQGKDTFVLANLAADRDVIRDFAPGKNTLAVSADLFGGGLVAGQSLDTAFEANGTGQATSGEDRFIYDTSNGRLYFDADGDGAGARVLIATLTGAPAISASDFAII